MPAPNAIRRMMEQDIASETALAAQGRITPAQFRASMREIIEEYNFASLREATGATRLRDVPSEVLGALDTHLDRQLAYLDRFAAEWEAAGGNAEAWKKAYTSRAQMYAGSLGTTEGLAAGVVKGGAIQLPAQPGQGSPCMSNCRCRWDRVDIDPALGVYEFYWRRSAAESCSTCVEREQMWSPLVVWGGEVMNA